MAQSASSLIGSSKAVGNANKATAAQGGRERTQPSIQRSPGQRPMRASRRCSGSQPHSSNRISSASRPLPRPVRARRGQCSR